MVTVTFVSLQFSVNAGKEVTWNLSPLWTITLHSITRQSGCENLLGHMWGKNSEWSHTLSSSTNFYYGCMCVGGETCLSDLTIVLKIRSAISLAEWNDQCIELRTAYEYLIYCRCHYCIFAVWRVSGAGKKLVEFCKNKVSWWALRLLSVSKVCWISLDSTLQ